MSQLTEIGIVDNCTPQERRLGKNFLREARHIAALVERHIPGLKTPNFWKILVICGTEDTRTHLKVIGGVLDVCVPCDLVNYYSGDSIAKKKFVLDALSKVLGNGDDPYGNWQTRIPGGNSEVSKLGKSVRISAEAAK